MTRIIWIMGPPGSGKSTIAAGVAATLRCDGVSTVVLDADHMREGPMSDLGFTAGDREENITRLALIANMLEKRGPAVVVAAVTPSHVYQRIAQTICDTLLVSLCGRQRALWAGTRFEPPANPDLAVDSVAMSVKECVEAVLKAFEETCR